MSSAWDALNERQQTYMKLIFERDQIQERNERMRSSSRRYAPHRSADEWRPILYADTVYGHTPLKQSLKDEGLVDPGTGSTFEALEKRGYIQVSYERVNPHPRADILVWIRLATKGRTLVRKARGSTGSSRLPTGTLREWHWRALCRAYVGGEQGMGSDNDIGDGFGYVSWLSCLRLRDYTVKGQECPLIRESRRGEQFALIITEFGKHYYCDNWQRYKEMYPDVDAPEPEKESIQ